ncbi:DNA repair protein RecN [Prevotella disiens JCM 6334 = ATCC 29426]|uniref:DNA repair protein RecN n=2 Tax=Prevotella disiens TaxID=28130 RepID=A0A379DZI7_9BACT|nr:DNA repair protein RecN [Prevotella disiens]ERJ71061.1 DNA repair protein RecN [Prevotella disiens JCM 6334 = ATCC 29426]SUB85878.1 Recombination protein N [Prevotella disiens]
MLKHLYIKNFTLIDELDIDFFNGFSVISGETGAGKSIILGAISLLLGNRADSKQIKQGEKKCIIEAVFTLAKGVYDDFFKANGIDLDIDETILRREINDSGKSRAFINDTPVSLTLMRELGDQLVDIHSQHQNLLLQKEDFQLNIVDIIARNEQELQHYKEAYTDYKNTEKRLAQLKKQLEESAENEEFMRFQYEEIANANLEKEEQEELEQEYKTLSHAEDIKVSLYDADNELNEDEMGVVKKLKKTADFLSSITAVYPKAEEISQRLDAVYIEVKDIAEEVGMATSDVDFDPKRLDFINEKLDKIYHLEKKFHVESIADLLDIANDLKTKLSAIDNSDEALNEVEAEVKAKEKRCKELAIALTNCRQKAAKIIEQDMKEKLVPMGIPNIQFQIAMDSKPLASDGADKVEVLFSANKNSPLQPIAQVASGGEIARVMLALKAMISGAVKLPTIIFDEIDTGVSGKVAQQMAFVMQEMGNKNKQVISITHLPQIAALGSTHYKVEKRDTEKGTTSRLRQLSEEERVTEIAQMLSGTDISEAALMNARELLKIN